MRNSSKFVIRKTICQFGRWFFIMQSTLDILCKANYTNYAKQTLLNGDEKVKNKLKELRKEKRISQEELALAVGVTRQTVTSIECEKYVASLALAYKIARYFELTIEEVFDLSEEVQDGKF